MAKQFDVYLSRNGTYVIVLQSDALDSLATRVVARLLPEDWNEPPFKYLSPEIDMGDLILRLQATELATLSLREIGTRVGSAAHMRDDIIRATDMLLTGY